MKTKALLITLIVLLSALLVWALAFWEPVPPKAVLKVPPHAELQLSSAPLGGDFTLQGPHGPVSLADFRGKVVLLYFGYTYCPDVCPTSLALLAQALSDLAPDELARVQPIFISVDPERDSIERLAEYAPFFHPSIIGLTGTPAQIAAAAGQYGASYAKQKPNADGLYAVDHSSQTSVIDPTGRLITSLPHGSSPQQIVDTVRPLLTASQVR